MTDKLNSLILECPHCDEFIEIPINQINCAIFRHGVFKDTFIQMCPHESKENCDKFIDGNLIYGCGNPFRLINEADIENKELIRYKLIMCDYV